MVLYLSQKNPHGSGSKQFKPMLFKGQLQASLRPCQRPSHSPLALLALQLRTSVQQIPVGNRK